MEFDGLRADEEPRGDLLVRERVGAAERGLQFLGCEPLLRRRPPTAPSLASRADLSARVFRPRPRTDTIECVCCLVEVLARLASLPEPAEPLAVAEVWAGGFEGAHV